MPRHTIIKMPKVKDKERTLKAARQKQLVPYKGAPIRLSSDFSTETSQARREWQEIFKAMKSKGLQPRSLWVVNQQSYDSEWKGSYRVSQTKKKKAKGVPNQYSMKY